MRLRNQCIAGTMLGTPAEVVRRLGAVQAQDYAGSLWAIGLRTRDAAEATIERAIEARTIVRTWPMRGTLHFVAAEDVRWLVGLLAPRVMKRMAGRYRQLGLDEAQFARCRKILVRALEGGIRRTRPQLYQLFTAAGISMADSRGLHVLGRFAQEQLICFGSKEGKQPTFVLLDEWVPAGAGMAREEALAELARRYFASHGPATVPDFAWWSGLTLTEVRTSLALAAAHLSHASIAGQTYWFAAAPQAAPRRSPTAYLLPAFDEYTVAYRDRSAVLDPAHSRKAASGGMLSPTIVVDARVVGTWKRRLAKGSVVVKPEPFAALSQAVTRAVDAAAQRYGDFLGLAAHVAW